MKYFKTLLLCLAALTFNACGDDDDPIVEPNYETFEIYINPAEADSKPQSVKFKAKAWTLTSDKMWCQLRQGDKTATSLTGGEGVHEVEIIVDSSAATDKEQVATLTINTNGQTYTLAHVTLGTVTYRGVIRMGENEYSSDHSSDIFVFEYKDGPITIQANFDYHIEMPDWCLMNGKRSFEGKADEQYEVQFAFNESAGLDKRYKQTGDLAFVGQSAKDVFTITYLGMDKYALEIEHKDTGLTPWNWSVNAKENTYTHLDGNDGVKVLNGGIPFKVTCRNDDVHFLFLTRQDGKQVFTTEVDYATVEGQGDSYTFSIKNVDNQASGGMLFAFSAAAWDTIQANPVAALTEWDEASGRNSLSSRALNNVVVSWTKYVEKTSPFTLHHLNKMIEDGDYYGFVPYETTSTTAYSNIFGSSAEVWETVIDIDDVDICIELTGYDNENDNSTFRAIKAGFDEKLDIDIETLRLEPWECSWPFDQPKKAAIMLNLSSGNGTEANPDYRAMLAASPLFIMMPVDGKTYGLVLKAK